MHWIGRGWVSDSSPPCAYLLAMPSEQAPQSFQASMRPSDVRAPVPGSEAHHVLLKPQLQKSYSRASFKTPGEQKDLYWIYKWVPTKYGRQGTKRGI